MTSQKEKIEITKDDISLLRDIEEKKFMYLNIPLQKGVGNTVISVSEPDLAPSNAQHKIIGNLDEIHCLFLAIENFLRIIGKVATTPKVYRTPFALDMKPTTAFYQINNGIDGKYHHHNDQFIDSDDDPGKLNSRCDGIKKNLSNCTCEYSSKVFDKTNQSLTIKLSFLDHNKLFPKIQVKVDYFNSLNKLIREKCIDDTYTLREILALRLSLFDFLRFRLRLFYDWSIFRHNKTKKVLIESRIQPYIGNSFLD